MTLYQQLDVAGCTLSHRDSDLYTPITAASVRLVHDFLFPASVSRFTDAATGAPMYRIRDAYDPYWQAGNGVI